MSALLALEVARRAAIAVNKVTTKVNNQKQKKQNKQGPAPQVKQKNGKQHPNRIQANSGSSPFVQALSDPFAPSSMGCKVPDPFPFPTQSYHLHQTTVLGTAAGESTGGVMYLPNPVFSLLDTNHINDATKNSIITTALVRLNTTSTIVPYGGLGACGITSLAGVLETYRVVSWGIKISNLQPELSATGRLIIAFLPIGDTVPSYAQLINSGMLATGYLPITGIPAGVLDSANLLQLPTAMEITVGDLLHGDIELSGMYTNSSFWTFRTPLQTSTPFAGSTEGDDVTQASGVVNTIGWKDSTRMVGGVGIALYYEGIPSSTSAFQVESIYHLEGTPAITLTSGISPVPSNVCKPYAGSSLEVEKGMNAVNSIEKVVKFVDRGANFLNKNKKTISNVMRGMSSYMSS